MDSSNSYSSNTTNIVNDSQIIDTRINYEIVPICALRPRSITVLGMLDPLKILCTEKQLPRDWRGLFHLSGLPVHYRQSIERHDSPTAAFLKFWNDSEIGNANLAQLQYFLEEIDRIDCLDDTMELFREDSIEYLKQQSKIKTKSKLDNLPRIVIDSTEEYGIITHDDQRLYEMGLPPQQYDTLIMFAEEDIEFATDVITKMEARNLKICFYERDVIAGHIFEHDTIRRLLTERCNRLLVILSPAFVLSPLNEYIANLAQSLGIHKRTRKLIPCIYKECEIPDIFQNLHKVLCSRPKTFYNVWDKLYDSLKPDQPIHMQAIPKITISDADAPPIPEPIPKTLPATTKNDKKSPKSTSTPAPTPQKSQSALEALTTSTISNLWSTLSMPRARTNSTASMYVNHKLNQCETTSSINNPDNNDISTPRQIFPPPPRRRTSSSMINLNMTGSSTFGNNINNGGGFGRSNGNLNGGMNGVNYSPGNGVQTYNENNEFDETNNNKVKTKKNKWKIFKSFLKKGDKELKKPKKKKRKFWFKTLA